MKYASKFFCMFGLFLSAVSLGSAQDKQSNTYFDQTREVNSKIWSQSYWRAMAEKGLVEVAKEVEVPKGRYTSDVIVSPLVLNPLSTDIPVSNLTNITQSENSIFVNPQDINNVLNSNNSTNWPVTLLYGTSGFYSTDGGQSWGGSPQGTGGSNYGDPAAVINLSGTFYVGFITSMGGQGIAYSTNQGATWTARQVAFENGSFMDKNHLWVDNSPTSPYAGYLYAAWTDFDGNNNSNIELSRSTDGGLTWSTPINVSSASGGLFHQGVNIQTGPNGEVYVVWTIYENWPQDEGAIGFAKSTNGGASFQPATRVISNIRGIRNTGTSKNMRVNSFPSSAVDISNGPNRGNIYVVWSNTGTPGENVGTDIDGYLVRSTDGGVSWSTPVKINQDPSGLGKQHYFQWITCDPVTGILAVVFYDDRNVSSTMCETFVAISVDAGSTWTDFKVSDVAFTPSPIPGLADGYFGDYLGISARSGRVYPIWTDNRDGRAMAYVSPFVLEKDSIPPAAVDDLAAIEPASNSITLTWTATGDDGDSGTASRYDIRYSLSPIDGLNFDSATQVDGEPVPQTAGSLETFTVHGLDFNTTYYFAIKAFDEWSNGSDVSNSPSATTLGIPDIAVSPESLSADLLTGGSETQVLTISNTAEGTLDFSFPDYAARALLSKPGIQKNDVSNDFEPVTLKKGEKDPREGHPIILGAGGPDNFGYRWIDSDEPGGPTFNWIDISGVGSPVYLGDDDFIEVNLPFSFPFYGVDKTNVKISSNGYLTFGSDAMSYTNEPIPSSALPNDFIAAFWDDLYPPSGGTIYYYYDEAENRFIVEYFNINHIGSIGTYTFEIILYPDGQILLQYLDVTGEVNASTTGIENADGMDGLQVAFNTDYVHDGLAVSIAAVPNWLSVNPAFGRVLAGQSMDIDVTFDATGMNGGDYYKDLTIASNDPDESVVSVLAHLHVTGAPDIAVDTDSLEYGTVFIGGSKTLTVKVSNPGTDVLNVTNITSSHGDYTVDSVSFSIAPRASRMVAVTLTPTTEGEISGTVTFESNDPDEPTVVVSVHGVGALPPDIAVTPDSLSEDLFTGETATQTITINNTGVSDLTFDIDVQNITAQGSFLKQTYIVNFEPEAYITKSTVLGKKQTIDGLGIHEMPKPFTVKKQVSSSGLHILLAMADDGASYITSQLLSYPDIASVSIFNTRFGTPTLDDLKNYDAVLTWSNYYPYDPVALGNVLADYVDQGGGVVIATFSFGYGALSGRIMDTSYSPLISAFRGNHYNAASMEILKPDHFIMTGVTNASDFYRDYTVLTEGSELVARWNDGENYVAAKGNIVGVNSYVGDYYSYTGDVPRIVYNCLLYVSGKGRWLSANPESGVVPAGQSLEITMTFDAAGLNGGDYYANIQVNSNDPDEPTVKVPAHLHVTGAPDIAFAPMSLEYRTVFIGGSATQTVIVSNPGTDVLNVTNVMSSHSDYTTNLTSFNLNPGQQQVVQVTFTPTTEGEIAGTLTFESNDPDEPTVVVSVHGVGVLPPDIAVTPDSLFADLFAGSTETQTLTISNTGNSDLLWQATTAFAERTAVVRTSPVFASSTRASQEKKLGSVPPAKPSEDEIYRMTAENITVASKPVKTLQGSPIGLLPQQTSLENILESLNENYTSVNSQIPNRYDFSEGESGYYISDGGDDMYDNGNFLGTNVGSYLYYSDNVITPSGYLGEGGRYFTRKYPGLFVFVADVNNVNYFEITGDLGADGSGNADGAVLEIQLHGVIYRGFVKRVYNAYDPSVNHLIIVADNPDAAHEFSTYTNDDYHRVYNITASRRIYYLLYAGTTGYYIDNSATFAIMNAFLNSLNLTPNWLTVNPTSGTVPAGSSMDVDVTFDAAWLNRGDYYASVNINSNDPDEPVVGMPAHLRVTGVLSGGFSVAIYIQNNDAERMLIFGSHTDATYCIDYALQEIELPPIPPTEVYDVRFIDPHGASECMGQGLQTNYHKWEMTPVTDTFQIRLQAGVGGYPIVLTWPSGLNAYYSSLSLQDIICGCIINVDMLTNTTFSITNTAIDKLNIVGVPLPNVGGPPSIAVTPTALNAMLNSGDTTTQSLLISNNGGSDLVFTIVIDSVVATKVSINTGIEQRGSGTPEKKLLKSNYSNGNVVEKGVVSFNVRRLGGLDWLSADPVSDTLHVGESMEVTMTFNATNLDSGDFYANVLVNSNDPSVPIVTIPAHLRVNEAMNLPPSAFHLISPKNLDTLKLDINCPPIMFSWHESLDPEGEDVFYSIRILGPNLDTTTVGLQDTSVELGIRCKLQPSMPYVWSVSATDGVNIVAALDTFIFVASDSVNAADDVRGKIPDRYTLLQNYPNPFNPATTFKYSLPTRSWVKLEIYNVLGQHIITLVDQTQETGYYEKTWNANVSSGMYFYRLEAVDVSNPSNTFIELKRMILLK